MTAKLCLLANAASPHTAKWASELARRGWQVDVVSVLDAEIPGVKVHLVPRILGKTADGIIMISWVKRLIERLAPDIVHAHYASSFGLIGALAGKHPLVISVWGTDVFGFPRKSFLHRALFRWTVKQAEILCSTSRVMAEELKRYTPKGREIRVIPFGVDTERFSPLGKKPIDPAPLVYGVAKYLHKVYGLDLLLEAFSTLWAKYPGRVRLKIAGDGPEKPSLQALADRLGIGPEIEWLGSIDNAQVAGFYRSLDVAVVPSRSESFGVTAVEAAACALPVIAARVGGLHEVVRDGKTGILVDTENSQMLAGAMERLLIQPEKRIELGAAGRRFVLDNYDWQLNVSQMERVYKGAL